MISSTVIYTYWYPVVPVLVFEEKKVKKTSIKKIEKGVGQRFRVGGNWEEMYDPIDGTKTWYNIMTKKTTGKDPFY